MDLPLAFGGAPKWRLCFAIKTAGGVPLQADITQNPNKGADKGDKTNYGEWYNIVGFQVMENLNAYGCWTFESSKSPVFGESLPSTPLITTIDGSGIPHGSILRVRLEHWGKSHAWESDRWEEGAWDEAILMTGLGYITKDHEDNYEVGETALITVTVPYIKSVSESDDGDGGFGFYLDAYHLGLDKFVTTKSGETVNRMPITKTTQTFKIPIKSEYFTNGSMDNQIWFSLFNELYPKDATDTDVVDIRGLSPPKPIVKNDKEEYFEGDTVTLTWQCSPNSVTDLPIVMAKVVAWIGGVEVFRESFAGLNEQGTASFIAPIAGFLDYRVSCIDSAGRGSGNDETVVIRNVLQNDFCTTNPDHPSCKDDDDDGFPLWEVLLITIAFIGAILVVAFMAYVMNSFGTPIYLTLIISVVVFLLLALAIAFVGEGAIDAIANHQAGWVK
jgi:hypothetical protein